MAKGNKQKTIIISPQAKQDILSTIIYLKENWGQKTVAEFLQNLEAFYRIISINPRLFGYYKKSRNIRNYAITKQNIIYYRIRKNAIELVTVFDGRQTPAKLKKIVKNHFNH
ncbi:MAG: type II toxin-antitoxin system RelE/ParE family toxin [Ginsengibacter sp.]